jgi:hypothetical protein
MGNKKWLLSLVFLTLVATGFGQSQQQQQMSDAISPLATSACQSTYTSGSGPSFCNSV